MSRRLVVLLLYISEYVRYIMSNDAPNEKYEAQKLNIMQESMGYMLKKNLRTANRYIKTDDETITRLVNLMAEMTMQANRKVVRVDAIKQSHHHQYEYQIGFAICEIKEKYRLINIIYTRLKNWKSNTIRIMKSLERVEHLGVEITNLAEMIYSNPKTRQIVKITRGRIRNKNYLRDRDENDEGAPEEEEENSLKVKEREYKRELKRQHQMLNARKKV